MLSIMKQGFKGKGSVYLIGKSNGTDQHRNQSRDKGSYSHKGTDTYRLKISQLESISKLLVGYVLVTFCTNAAQGAQWLCTMPTQPRQTASNAATECFSPPIKHHDGQRVHWFPADFNSACMDDSPLEVLLLSSAGRWAPAPPVAPEPSRFTAGLRCDDTCTQQYMTLQVILVHQFLLD